MKKVLLFSLAIVLNISVFAENKLLGGDLSLVPAYETAGDKWLDANGNEISDLITFLRDEAHWNAVRVRLVVNPQNAGDVAICQDLDYVKALGKRVKDAGMNFLLDIFYSDTWADVSQQWIPADWSMTASTDVSDLAKQVTEYTTDVINALVSAGATPDYIQIGNEVSYGMLWSTASENSMSNAFYTFDGADNQYSSQINRFVTLLNAGVAGVKASDASNAKIIIQCERSGTEAYNFYNFIETADYDIIGLSYYPMWQGSLGDLQNTLDKLAEFEKPIQIVETAYYNDNMQESWFGSSDNVNACSWNLSFDGQAAFMKDLVSTLKDYNVTGLYYWFPEECGCGYGSIDNSKTVLQDWVNRGLWSSYNSQSHNLGGAQTLTNMAEYLGYYQTMVDKDITDDYFVNFDFEQYDADWNLSNEANLTLLEIRADGYASTLTDGYLCVGWNQQSTSFNQGTIISQKSKTVLPAGTYNVSCVAYSNTADLIALFANDEQTIIPVSDNWATAFNVEVEITLETDDYLTVGIKTLSNCTSTNELNIYFDNFKLTTQVPSANPKPITADAEKTILAYYNLLGQKLSSPQKGVNIILFSDGTSQKILVK